MKQLALLQAAALLLGTAVFSALPLSASANITSTFYGIAVHVSTENIKVQDPKTKQTMSFAILPKFDQVFSADGKTTYQMRKVKAGQYVGIVYDRKALGMAHADKIYLMDNADERIGSQ